jgi:hypothetical protein
MLLISVIKYLIVMPDVKDLAQAAQGAAAPENVNVVNPTTSVNQPVQPTVDTDNQSSAQVETIDDVVRRICTDGHSYVMTTVITNIDCQERTGRNGKSYLNGFHLRRTLVICINSRLNRLVNTSSWINYINILRSSSTLCSLC